MEREVGRQGSDGQQAQVVKEQRMVWMILGSTLWVLLPLTAIAYYELRSKNDDQE